MTQQQQKASEGTSVEHDLERRFSHHPPKDDQPERYTLMRERFHALAGDVVAYTPKSREQSLALTHLETALMFANAAIARNE